MRLWEVNIYGSLTCTYKQESTYTTKVTLWRIDRMATNICKNSNKNWSQNQIHKHMQSNRCIHTSTHTPHTSHNCKHNDEHDHIFHVTFRPFAVLISVSLNIYWFTFWCAHQHHIILSLFVIFSRCHTHDSDHLSSLCSSTAEEFHSHFPKTETKKKGSSNNTRVSSLFHKLSWIHREHVTAPKFRSR